MKTTKIETKTFYHVSLDWADIAAACDSYRKAVEGHSADVIGSEGAFGFVDEDITAGSVTGAMRRWAVEGDVATCNWLAKHFGFDGVQFCGVYHEQDKTVRFTFYNEGACI